MIKNIVFFCLLFLATSGFFSAQAQGSKEYFIGIKGGLSIPNLTAGASKNVWNQDYKSRIGPNFGVFAEIPLHKNWSLVPELTFAGQGGKRDNIQPMTIPAQYLQMFQAAFNTTNDYAFANLNNVSRINYLQLPIQLKYHRTIGMQGKLDAYLQAGFFGGYIVSAKQIIRSENLKVYLDAAGNQEIPGELVAGFFGTSIDTVIDAKNDLHRWNVGLQGAVGLSYKVGKGKILIEGGGNYGFLYIQKGDEHGKNRIGAGTVLVGYAHPLS